MDSFELNKILGALLFTCLALVALSITAGAVFSPQNPAKPGFAIAVQEQSGNANQAPAAPTEEPIEKRLASADQTRGASTAKQCQACHTFEKGGPNRTGPNLWGIVGRPRASEAGFNYSSAMKAKGGSWTIDDLDKFLTKPQGYIPGTAMGFAGLPRGQQRADVITYLNSLSDNPKPLPKAAEAAPAGAKAAQNPTPKPH
jgi:cytochrome c